MMISDQVFHVGEKVVVNNEIPYFKIWEQLNEPTGPFVIEGVYEISNNRQELIINSKRYSSFWFKKV